MALTPASVLADYSSGIGTQGATLQIKTEDQRVGIGTTNPQGTLQVGTAITMGSGIITATAADLSGTVTASTASFSGNVNVGGVLTYEDVTSVDSVGIITARSNVIVGGGLSVTGISTFNGITTSTTTIFTKDFSVSGVSTLGGNVVVGGATTELVVTGDARVTGILTVGTASLTLNGTTGAITGGSLTNAQVAAISTSIVGTGTTVDVFVYDTSKDSDGGAWRKRTQHTSWYNETLNTATRGSRREFPAVAVIVAETAKVTIYDGDDPDLPMWMVFNSTTNRSFVGYQSNPEIDSVKALNASLAVGSSGELNEINFLRDNSFRLGSTASWYTTNNISQRNVDFTSFTDTGLRSVAGGDYHVAMTVLPNAPINDTTGLPVPTIAVATSGGISVINDTGTVNNFSDNLGATRAFNSVIITGEDIVGYNDPNGTIQRFFDALSLRANNDVEMKYNYTYDGGGGSTENISAVLRATGGANILLEKGKTAKDFYAGNVDGISVFRDGEDREFTPSSFSIYDSSVAYITSDYNTGWMHGDIKGAWLSSSDTTSLDGTEIITNGTFTSDTTGWGAANGATLTQQNNGNPGGNINVASGPSSNGYASQSNTVVVGKYYTLSFDHYHVDGSAGYVNIGTTTGGSEYIYQNLGTSSSWTRYSFTVKATSTNMFTGFYSRPNGNVRYDNISLKEADPDRSVNNNGLQTFGTMTKSAVATGADLVAYSGFSASNYLQQPYTSDLDFGTGDLSISFWYKTPSGSVPTECFLHRGDGGAGTWGTGKIIQIEFNGTNLASYLAESAFSSTDNVNIPGATAATGQWMHYTLVRRGTFVGVYLNGEFIASTTPSSSRDLTNTSAKTWIGERPNVSRPATTSALALLRMSASAPSVEQIKKMYDDEKVLFQENSQATLYGSSDAVTALAYDDDEETLYVGTSSGRSDFRGLRRINNTTTAVTTAISASNGLVAEQ